MVREPDVTARSSNSPMARAMPIGVATQNIDKLIIIPLRNISCQRRLVDLFVIFVNLIKLWGPSRMVDNIDYRPEILNNTTVLIFSFMIYILQIINTFVVKTHFNFNPASNSFVPTANATTHLCISIAPAS